MPSPSFLQQVTEAFKHANSVLALSRSPLAATGLVRPALVADDLSPTADERGQALRLALQWSVEQLAPGPAAHPFGQARPFDDPTWADPRWWRYTILRHRYLEPLHPDNFVEGGRFTETLLALTGIPSTDLLFDERNRALREAATWLERQMAAGVGEERLRTMALDAALAPLARRPAQMALLGVAAIFDDVFPRALLLEVADAERVENAEAVLHELAAARLLLGGDGGASLWMSAPLRAGVVALQPAGAQVRRHAVAARLRAARHEPAAAARHWQAAGRWEEAAALLLGAAAQPGGDAAADAAALRAFPRGALPAATWCALQLRLADLLAATGQPEEALAACREAVRADDAQQQARAYRRMGKIYEEQNQQHALAYYGMAAERFAPDDPEFCVLLKDRAWLSILRREWAAAAADLDRALGLVPAQALGARADLYDARSSLMRGQGRLDAALEHARGALALREQAGDLGGVAKSFNTLGILYRMAGDHAQAVAAYREAIDLYRRLDNQPLIATALLNIGAAEHFAGRREEAVARYRECLRLCQEVGLPLTEVRAQGNAAEALVELGRVEEARAAWRRGYELSVDSGFDDEIAYLAELADRFPGLGEADPALPPAPALGGMEPWPAPARADAGPRDAVEQTALALAAQPGGVSARALMAAAHVSKPTATRKLADLEGRRLLRRAGRGRATVYSTEAAAPTGDAAARAAVQARLDAALPALRRAFGVDALAVMGVWPGPRGARAEVAARFRARPALEAFFALEERAGEVAGVDVNLALG